MKHPIQPIEADSHEVLRFKENRIVRDLLDFATPRGFGLNEMACRDYSLDDRRQFAQLIGYSLSGYADLSYVDDLTYETAGTMLESGVDERDARIQVLESMLEELRSGIRAPIARLFGIHPDDLGEQQ